MPTAAERLRPINAKTERAKEHIADLEAALRAWIETKPYGVGCKRNPQTRQPVYYVSHARPVPDRLALIAGDAIQNLISALDHLAYQLVCSDTGDNPPNPRGIYFPIGKDRQSYEAKAPGKMQGAVPATLAMIDAVHPYKGGNDVLWTLAALNNVNKHRLLLVVGAQAASIDLLSLAWPLMSKGMAERDRAAFATMMRSMTFTAAPKDKGFPLKEGFELYIGVPDEEPNPDLKLTFTVAIGEPGIAEGEPVLDLLKQATKLVEAVVRTLTPRLR